MIVFEHVDEEDSTIWNKRNNKTQLKSLILRQSRNTQQENLELNKQWASQNFARRRYTFLNLKGLFDADNYQVLPYISIQTVGLIRLVKDGFKLHSIAGNSKTRIDLIFKTEQILEEKNSEFYAQVFGFCKFYKDELKDIPVHPEDCSGIFRLEFTIEYYVTLTNFDNASRIEKLLSNFTRLKIY